MSIPTVCSLQEYHTLKDFLEQCYDVGSSRMKKASLDRAKLLRPVTAKQELDIPLELTHYGEINPRYDGPSLKIIYEDDELLAFSKPEKIHSHPLGYDESDNCLSFFREQANYRDVLEVNKDNYDRGLLFRLDQETSGLMLMAKKDYVYHYIRDNYPQVVTQKKYLAVTCAIGPQKDSACHYLVTEGPKGAKMLAQENIGAAKNGKIARIDDQLLLEREDMGLGLYLITLRQGLRHQIRVQLAAQGLPILGDRLYGGDWGERMYLHSLSYSLEYQGRPYQLVDKNLGDFDRLFDPDRIFQMLRDKAGIF